ncbi:nuclear transport factor 2 family protein [Rhizobium grahamii]|uniref:Nuclear transport factor 2 family protein n=1 Tax=Rhizobium grahamii TaxID=1120045 RepID=A0A5Q0C7L1_9HYPH|nr:MULTISPECIES: nuclear transport factor 2 family protein [Rhizobium]QFY61295.1 nuclear transport factor 2 family protein [Rhizobium grahamii]QRM49556.1 nuclear transport factor 2 family protein [Rhizobium sp. BG6]
MNDLGEHLRVLEERLFEQQVRNSRPALEALLSPEFREIGASGTLYTYDTIIAALLQEPADGIKRRLTDFETRLLAPSLALVTYRAVRDIPAEPSVHSLRSSLWRQEPDGQWRMVFHQGTLAA